MQIDLNADVGESYGPFTIGEDFALFESITSANIACGFHAGDFNVMERTVGKAVEQNISIGAHPGFPDIQGFGRRAIPMPPREIYNAVVYQIGALKQFCEIHGVPIAHVKPHGALYNMAAIDKELAEAIAEAVYDSVPNAYLYGLYNSKLIEAGNKIGLKTAGEAFADRRYTAAGTLSSRLEPNSVLQNYEEIEKQVIAIVLDKKVETTSGATIPLEADTICFHSDGIGIAQHARTIRRILEANHVHVKALGSSL